ncbi:MAG: hypothetical protein DDT21_01584 [Syntrophomonadaceae bacterium]|nr:hypothetical protein [Bacillota bacterium]
MSEEILTVPVAAKAYKTWLVHGNEYLSFPDIDPQDAGLGSVNVLHMGALSLLEFTGKGGKALLAPYCKINGQDVPLKKMIWSSRFFWLPVFSGQAGVLAVRGKIFAPPGHRGAVYLLEVRNAGGEPLTAEAGFKVCCAGVSRRIFRTVPVGRCRMEWDEWTKSLVLLAGREVPLAALALSLEGGRPWCCTVTAGKTAEARGGMTVELAPGESFTLPLYLAVNIEGSGAATTTVDLRRRGAQVLLAATEGWLAARVLPLQRFRALANRNLFFNYFFALGRTVDTDQLAAVTSRSPRYYVSAAFWGRDCLLWSFPGVLLADRKTARELLLTVFSRHLERAGEHAHYINGVLLYPGFELDQLAAYFLALKIYLQQTGDISLLRENTMEDGLVTAAGKLLAARDRETGLYATFLDPSDDQPSYPFLVYDNALAERALSFLAGLQENGLTFPQRMTLMAGDLRAAILRHGVVDGPFGPMFAWAVNGKGNYELYDNPPGSLQLLPHYGFCTKDDLVFLNTVRWIHSRHNPFFAAGRNISGAASRHASNPWPLHAVNDLLALNLGQEKFFRRAVMDSGYFCETVEPVNGRASTGQAFASGAGFLAFALWHTLGREMKAGGE